MSLHLQINPFESVSLENSDGYSWHSTGIRKFPLPYLVSYYTSQLAYTPMMQHAEQSWALFSYNLALNMFALFQYYTEPFFLAPLGSLNDVQDFNICEETPSSVFTLLTDQLQVCRAQ